MTIEELADLSADKLEALSNDQLTAILSPFYNVTRPELVQRNEPVSKVSSIVTASMSPEKRRALEALAQTGLDLSFLNKKKK